MADQILTPQRLINGDKDLQTIEDFMKIKDETITTRFGDEIMTMNGLQEEVKKSGGYFKRYTSLASANADIANIPVDAVVKVTSAADGGDYEKKTAEATSLTKSAYDPVEINKEWVNTEFKNNIFNALGVSFSYENIDANYVAGSLTGNSIGSPSSFSTTNATARSKIFKVEPGTLYTVAKQLSNRFRIAEFSNFPTNGSTPVYFTKDEYVSSVKDGDVEYFTFTTQQTTSYIVVYVSSTSEEPVLHCYAGEYISFQDSVVIDKPVEINGELNLKAGLRVPGEFTSGNIVKGKNLFKGDEYLEGNIVLSGQVGTTRKIIVGTTTVNAKTAILKINPNTTYTVSKSASDRFRIGLCDVKPTLGTANIEIIAGESNDSSSQFTFTSKNTTNYLVLYLAANTAAPSEVQVEEGETATEYESFGYKFFPEAKSKGSSSGSAAYDYAGVGDANYISKAEATAGAWKDSQYTIPATDDTDTLQALFDSAKGVVSLEPNKKYKVTRSIRYNPERVKLVKGNMAHIVCIGDIETFQMVGTLASSASAAGMNRRLAYNEMSPLVVALRITNPMEVLGTAFVVEKCMSPNFLACNFKYVRRGIVFRGVNRNAIINACHIYACYDYGIHFEEGGDIHQINITGSHISYCRKNIFSENHNIYNIQITGGDIETSSYPTLGIGGAAECDMHFLQTTAILEDLEIVGNTIEDHWNTTKMIRLEGNPTSTDKISCVTISGNVTGNSAGSVIEIGGASGVEIVGQFKANQGYVVDVIGNLNGFKLSTQSKQNGGGLFRAVGDYTLKDVTVCGNNLSNSVTQNPILVDVKSLDNCNFSRNDLRVTGTGGFHATHKAPITIHADTMKLVRADNNTIANSVSLTKAVEIVARNSSEKGSMRGNMANSGAFTAPSSFLVEANQ